MYANGKRPGRGLGIPRISAVEMQTKLVVPKAFMGIIASMFHTLTTRRLHQVVMGQSLL